MFLILHGFGLRGYDKVWMKVGERGTGERLRDYAMFCVVPFCLVIIVMGRSYISILTPLPSITKRGCCTELWISLNGMGALFLVFGFFLLRCCSLRNLPVLRYIITFIHTVDVPAK